MKIKDNFKIDFYTGEEIPLKIYREKLKNKLKRKNVYISEIADFYYQEKYSKNILYALSLRYNIPRCPITDEFVSYSLNGSVIMGKFSSSCTPSQITQYSLKNNEHYQKKIEEFKIIRKGSGNPMFGKIPWNKNKNKNNCDAIKVSAENRRGITFSKETLKRMSKSAKKRDVHGHTGHKHSEESKQIMREKTIERFRRGKFPQTNSLPHRIVKKILEDIFGECGKDFFEEKGYGNFAFDFCVGSFLIEVQGDYFHCNPNTRHAKPKNKMQENNLKRDKRKKEFVIKDNKYKLVELWENDIINNKEKIILCLKSLRKS